MPPSGKGGGSPWDDLQAAGFVIGKDDQLAGLKEQHAAPPGDADGMDRLKASWSRQIADLHIRTGTLLKSDTVSILLGAGASKECGGPLLGTIPLEFERRLLREGIRGSSKPRVSRWLVAFYHAAARAGAPAVPANRTTIIQRQASVEAMGASEISANLELLLSVLHRWRSAAPEKRARFRLDGTPAVDFMGEVIDECLERAASALLDLCELPRAGSGDKGFKAYKDLLRKVLTRPLNLKRPNFFTLNYDTLVEQAADSEGVVLLDGFVGSVSRTFRPESYDHDLYFPGQTTEGRVHRLDRVIHLYKLHGSITWSGELPSWDNPYGVRCHSSRPAAGTRVLIYPTPAKWGDVLGMPYGELLRRFATAVVRPQSVLFVIGYAFGDEHICAIVRQALSVPSFTLVIADPKPQSAFMKELLALDDRRVWVLSGETLGTFTGFVGSALGDLQDEAIRQKVIDTHRALTKT